MPVPSAPLSLPREIQRPVESFGELMCTCDLARNIIELNEAVEQVTGYSREEALAMNARDFLNGNDWDRIVHGGESAQPHSLTIRTKDGSRVSLAVTTRLVVEQGSPVAIQVTAPDGEPLGHCFTHHLK